MSPPAGEEAPPGALALHGFLVGRHLRDDVLVGPDSGVRYNYRLGRFVKSYTRRLGWRDDLTYLQTQGYWVSANWRLSSSPVEHDCRALAVAASRGILARQRADGAWDYPNPEWRGRVATVEGTWAAIGLLETHRRTLEPAFLDGALAWHRFLEEQIGWTPAPGGAAVNYFAGGAGAAVPNNSALVLRLLAELARATGDGQFLRRAAPMVGFLSAVQRPTGELPYNVDPGGAIHTAHFQCMQYSAFQALDLDRYARLTGDAEAEAVLERLLRFLRDRIGSGRVPYACDRRHPSVTYHLAAVAAALEAGAARDMPGCDEIARRVRSELLARQGDDGGFPHSRRDYGFLTDRRAYPRNLAMILLHLLHADASAASRQPSATVPGARHGLARVR